MHIRSFNSKNIIYVNIQSECSLNSKGKFSISNGGVIICQNREGIWNIFPACQGEENVDYKMIAYEQDKREMISNIYMQTTIYRQPDTNTFQPHFSIEKVN